MKQNILVVLIMVILLGVWISKNQDKAKEWMNKVSQTEVMGTKLFDAKSVQDTITKGWSEDFVRQQLDTFVIKDGISLPDGWKLDQKKIDGTFITIIVPPNPTDENDFIAPRLKTELVDTLPDPHMCDTSTGPTTTCVVGQNMETHRAFHLMVYL